MKPGGVGSFLLPCCFISHGCEGRGAQTGITGGTDAAGGGIYTGERLDGRIIGELGNPASKKADNQKWVKYGKRPN